MKNTTKTIIIAFVLVILIAILSFRTSGFVKDNYIDDYNYSWTKAICNETHCQDYVIYCNGEDFLGKSPITGAVISIPSGWEDPRNETMRERVCE